MGALMHFKRPEVTVDGHDVKIHTADEKEPTRLTLHHKPFCVTIGYIEDNRTGEILIRFKNSDKELRFGWR
jgi:exosome complex component RRP45